MIYGLAEAGFIDGESIAIQRYQAEGEIPTLNLIAREIAGGAFDLIITSTTPALQAVANANKQGKLPHVFGLVGDPAGAGVGISREDPLDHPSHLVGLGTMMPVEETFRLARELLLSLRRVGVVWNPAEAASEANTRVAREICQELDIELLESNVINSSEVYEAASSLASRGAEAFWVGPDIVVLGALDSLVGLARKAHIPVFTSISGSAKRGALFDLGPDYHEIGRKANRGARRQSLRGHGSGRDSRQEHSHLEAADQQDCTGGSARRLETPRARSTEGRCGHRWNGTP